MSFFPIQGYENYNLHNCGKVVNSSNRELATRVQKSGYRYVSLCKKGKQLHFTIHRLLAIHFIPNPDNLPCVDHINRNKLDNRIENLRWCTHKENCANRGISVLYKTSTTGERFISNDNARKKFVFRTGGKHTNGIKVMKRFDTVEEAIQARDDFLEENNITL